MCDCAWRSLSHLSVDTDKLQYPHARVCKVEKTEVSARAAVEGPDRASSSQCLQILEGGRRGCVVCEGCLWIGAKESTVRCWVLSVGLLLSEFNALKQKLTPAEEEVLVASILKASWHGFPPTHHQVAIEADHIQSACLSYQPVEKQWVNEVLQRHNKVIKSHWSALLSTIRAQSANPQAIYNFLTGLVKSEVVDKDVPPELLYQIDETSTLQQLGIKLRVMGPRELRHQHLQESGTKENITALVTICADGTALPPTIVFKNKELLEDIYLLKPSVSDG